LVEDRVGLQNQIKGFLCFYGIELPRESQGKWPVVYVENLHRLRLGDKYLQQSFDNLLAQFDSTSQLLSQQTQLLKELSQDDLYRERVEILCSMPGIGWLSAMEILLELQDVARFRKADQLSAYVGLTPSQYSSGGNVRMGRITRQGKPSVRTVLIQAAWRSLSQDPVLAEKYERIKARSGGKRAVVAIARTLLIRLRRLLLRGERYELGLVNG
jgi:transposase